MRKKILLLTACLMAFVWVLVACGNNDDTANGRDPSPAGENGGQAAAGDSQFAEFGLDDNMRFIEPRTITVALWDRDDERVPEFDQSHWARWVQDEILERHNIIVEWQPVPRWTEGDFQSTALASQTAPDVGYTFNNGIVTSMAEMGGMINLYDELARYSDLLPNLYNLLGEEHIYWNLNPDTNELWSITGRRSLDGGTVTFIREDWLDALDLPIPTTTAEFEDTLIAFRDNAADLVDDPSQIIPYFLTNDVGWDAMALFDSFIPNDITEREWYINNFNDRRFFHEDAIREGARVLNHWFHEGLLWNDFVIAEPSVGHDLIRLGYVGAFHVNWDLPFRPGDNWIGGMRENVGEEANFIPINPFENDAGVNRKFMSPPTDRFIFFPRTNEEVLASLLYLDFMSSPDVLDFLQFGYEGVHHNVLEGNVFEMLAEPDDQPWPDDQVFASGRNFDLTPTINGIHFDWLDLPRAEATLAVGYPGFSQDVIMEALYMGLDHSQVFRNVVTRIIASEEGMSGPLRVEGDGLLHRLIADTSPEDFDAAFEAEYETWLNLGAREIREEREQAWIERFGDADSQPDS